LTSNRDCWAIGVVFLQRAEGHHAAPGYRDPVPGIVRGGCPSVHEPFAEPDGMLLRLRLPGGLLPARGARRVAEALAEVGAGPIELTNRANLQLRGIAPDAVGRVRDAVLAAELASPEPDVDARRNVVASPTAGIDPEELVDTRPLVADIAARLSTAPRGAALSPKFGVVVDGGGGVGVRGRALDLALGAVQMHAGELRYEVRLAEPLPRRHQSDEQVWLVDPAALLTLVDAVVDVCAPLGRARDLVSARGAERVMHDLSARVEGALVCRVAAELVPPPVQDASAVGAHPQSRPGAVYVGALVVLGRLAPATLGALADLAGLRTMRVSPARSIVIPDVADADAAAVVSACERIGMVCDRAHPATSVVACIGRVGCASGHVDALADARMLITKLAARSCDRRARSVHVSGCEKACASSGPDDVTIVGGPRDGCYAVHRRNPGSDTPFGELVTADLTPSAAVDAAIALCEGT
jgi:precorrin-3B synthase